jgi:MHS family proline/betaine transporter-like MFS transporter
MKKARVIVASFIGNALEFYDFTLYGVMGVILAKHFFPSDDEFISLINSFGAFAAGYVMRPFGALVFGYIGDKLGRKKALSTTIILMGIPTLVVGCTPSYEIIGVLAPIIIIFARLIQGLCTGGEYNGAAIFALEHVGKNYPSFTGGLITGSCVVGATMATFLGSQVTKPDMPDWAWRVPFILGAGISLIGYFIRKKLSETPEFKKITPDNSLKLFKLITDYYKPFISSFVIGSFNGALTYTLFAFLNVYLHKYLNIPLNQAMQSNLYGLFAFMLGCPIMGYIMDKIGRREFITYASLIILITGYPMFTLFTSNVGKVENLWLPQIILGLFVASIAGSAHGFIQNLFPTKHRYKGVSFSFSLGMGIIGGTTPMILLGLVNKTNNLIIPAFYIASWAFVMLVTLKVFKSDFYDK